jgi:DNA-binding response OmpR family regulator
MYFRRKKTRASLLDVRPDIPAETVRQTRVTRLDRTVKPAKHKRILLFDDNVNWARIFQFCLEKEGFEVHHSIDPRDVMKRIDEVRPDLVVMDLHFPGFSGSEAIRQIKSREANRELPVIMLTVDDTQTAKMEAMKAGARNFLSKSISNEQLVGAIKAYMANTAFKGTIVPDSTGRPPSSSGSEP